MNAHIFVFVLIATVTNVSYAASITYSLIPETFASANLSKGGTITGPFVVTGIVTTDGALGLLKTTDILSWSFYVNGVLDGYSSDPSSHGASFDNLSATATSLYFPVTSLNHGSGDWGMYTELDPKYVDTQFPFSNSHQYDFKTSADLGLVNAQISMRLGFPYGDDVATAGQQVTELIAGASIPYATVVPEPSSMALLVSAIALAAVGRRCFL